MKVGVLEIELLANMARLSDDMRRAERVVGDGMSKVERHVASASRALSSFGIGLSVGLIADQLRRMSDQFVKMDAQLQNSTKSQQQYNTALADIRRISTIAQTDISATTMLYTRLLNVMDGTGVSQSKLATVTETVSYGLKAYGATAAEAASASLQLSQAMGANRLGGEEFRATMEAMPNVMKVLAKSMGVPLGELRALSIAGKITAAEMVKAFGDPAVAAEFKRLALNAQTITGAWTVARNEFMLLFGEFAKSSGLTSGMIAAFSGLAGTLRIVAKYIDEITTLMLVYGSVKIGRIIWEYVAAMYAQRAAALAVAQAELVKINMTYGASVAARAAAVAAVAQATANMTLVGALRAATVAMRTFLATNPLGWIVLALSAGITAWQAWGDAAEKAATKATVAVTGAMEAMRRWNGIIAANKTAAEAARKDWEKFHTTEAEKKALEVRELNEKYAAMLKHEGFSNDARLKLAREYKVKYDDIMRERSEGTSIMARMRIDLEAANEAELSGRLSNVEKVGAAWAKLTDRQRSDAKMQSEYEAALTQARIADWHKVRDTISQSITQGIMDGAKAEDVLKKMFEDMVLEPQVKLAVTAGVDWVAQMLGLTTTTATQTTATTALIAALNANTAAQGGNAVGGAAGAGAGAGLMGTSALSAAGIGLIVVAAAYLAWDAFQSRTRRTSGISGSFGPDGVTATGWTRTDTRGGLFAGGNSSSTRVFDLTARALHDLNVTFTSTRDKFVTFGDQLGLSTEAVENFAMSFKVTGGGIDGLFKAVGDRMAYSLLNVDVDKATRDYFDSKRATTGRYGIPVNSPGSTRTYQSVVDAAMRPMYRGNPDVKNLAEINKIIESRLPDWFKYLRNEGEGLADALARIGANVSLTSNLMDALGSTMFSSIADFGAATIAMSEFVDKLGGIEDATSKASSFIQNFAPTQVLADIAQGQLEAVGLPLLQTTEEWFAYAQTASEEQLVALLNNQPVIRAYLDALAKLDTAETAAAAATTAAAEAATKAAEALAKTNLGWQQQIDVLLGNRTQREVDLENALSGVDTTTAVLINRLYGLQDAATVSADAVALAKTNLGWQQQIDVLLGNRTQREVDLENALSGVDTTTAALINQLYSLQDAADITATALERITVNSFASLIDYNRAMSLATGAAVPGFASGGNFAGGLRIVGENGPEIEATGASRIYSASQTQSMLSGGQDVVAELRALRADLRASQSAIASNTDKTQKVLTKFDRLGMPAERVI